MGRDPLIFEIKGNALDDGPGIRSVVFFKGCPLRCPWCHNPEGIAPRVEVAVDPGRCVSTCSACVDACPEGALEVFSPRPGREKERTRARLSFVGEVARWARAVGVRGRTHPPVREEAGQSGEESASFPVRIRRDRCVACGRCVDRCPSGALSRVGRSMSVEAVLEEVLRDRPFFVASGGGLTLSGGEPTRQPEAAGALARAAKGEQLHVLLETCGLFSLDTFDRHLYPYLDEIYFDLKLIDPGRHRVWCGADNGRILENFLTLHQRSLRGGVPVLARVPLIPGVTDTDENLEAVARFFRVHGVTRAALLPYHPLWRDKRARLGLEEVTLPAECRAWMPPERLAACRRWFEGVDLVV